jgi:hypothetical protein
MMKIFLLATLPAIMLGQQPKTETPDEQIKKLMQEMGATSDRTTKIVRVHFANAERLCELVRSGPVVVKCDNVLHAVVLSGKASDVTALEQTVHELDTQSSPLAKDIEVTVSVIGGSSKPGILPEGQIPQALEPVVKQLSAIFPYKSFQLLSTMVMRSREGTSAQNKGVMQGLTILPSDQRFTGYGVHYDDPTIAQDQHQTVIHLRNFQFAASIPLPSGANSMQFHDVLVASDVDLRDGQKVVVGKANVENSDTAMFVVLTARVAD